jgi:hypothetical protein
MLYVQSKVGGPDHTNGSRSRGGSSNSSIQSRQTLRSRENSSASTHTPLEHLLDRQEPQAVLSLAEGDVSFVQQLAKSYQKADKVGMNDPVIQGLLRTPHRQGGGKFSVSQTMTRAASREGFGRGMTMDDAVQDADDEVRVVRQTCNDGVVV